MKSTVKNNSGCSRTIDIEISQTELNEQFDHVYAEIRKSARVPGFRPGRAPRDLLETHYGARAKEEVLRRAIPEYYVLAVRQEGLVPVAAPEIENVQLKQELLRFSARIDVRPQVKIKSYKQLKTTRRKVEVKPEQIDQALERLRQSRKADQAPLPQSDENLAKNMGFNSVSELRGAIRNNLESYAETESRKDLERQILEQLLKKASLDIPQSLANRQTQESFNQLRMSCILRGEDEEQIKSKEEQLQDEARRLAEQKVKLSFILEEIARLEDIQVRDNELEARMESIAQHSGKTREQIREYLEKEDLLPGVKAEIRDAKTVEFLLKAADVKGDVTG